MSENHLSTYKTVKISLITFKLVFWFSWYKHPEMKWLDHIAVPFNFFAKTAQCFIVVASIDIPQTEHDDSLLFTFQSISFIA